MPCRHHHCVYPIPTYLLLTFETYNQKHYLRIAPYQAIRLTDKQSADRLRQIGGIRILTRGDGELVALFENRYRLQRLMSDEPELTLEPIIADATVL